MKKVLSFVLVLCLVVAALPLNAGAAAQLDAPVNFRWDTEAPGSIYWEYSDATIAGMKHNAWNTCLAVFNSSDKWGDHMQSLTGFPVFEEYSERYGWSEKYHVLDLTEDLEYLNEMEGEEGTYYCYMAITDDGGGDDDSDFDWDFYFALEEYLLKLENKETTEKFTYKGSVFSDFVRTGNYRLNEPVTPAATEVHFPRKNSYQQGQFKDVTSGAWYANTVSEAFILGLMKGTSEEKKTFSPLNNFTLSEAITLAARIHSIYATGTENFKQASTWYQVYYDYALNNGIIGQKYYQMNPRAVATRAQFAEILAAALPEDALPAINDIPDNAIPDVKMTTEESDSIYLLYRAGVLTGKSGAGIATGTFDPSSSITRAEVATIAARMAESSNRQSFKLG